MSADNYGNDNGSDITCIHGHRVSVQCASAFMYPLNYLNIDSELTFYNLYKGTNSHSKILPTKNDFLSKSYNSISTLNIDDVNFMLFVGHGLGNNMHFSNDPNGTKHINDINNCHISDFNFNLAEAKFGYGNSKTKWVFEYTCNYLNGSLDNVKKMMQGCNIVLGYDGTAYLTELLTKEMSNNLKNGQTIINLFFNTSYIHTRDAKFSTQFGAIYVNDAYSDTIYRHLKDAGNYHYETIQYDYVNV